MALAAPGVRLQRVCERLSPLSEHGTNHTLELALVGDAHRDRTERQSDDGRMDLRSRPEGSWRQREHSPNIGMQLDEDREYAVVSGARHCQDPIRYLTLQHQGRINDGYLTSVRIENPEQNRRRDVVWKIA